MASFIKSDLAFILEQILIAERHAAGEDLFSLLPNPLIAFGLRTVDGSFNNLLPGKSSFGAADTVFPRLTTPFFRTADVFDPDGPGPAPATQTSYAQTSGLVVDAQPRTISNLIVDMTANNPAAVAAAYDPGPDGVLGTADDFLKDGAEIVVSPGLDGVFGTADDKEVFFIPNIAADAGLSAPFNAWMTFFGQFFDHGLDLVTKGGSGTVFIPLQPDDPLFVPGSQTNFMVLERATNQPGPDGILGTADDIHEHTNTTTPFVDQNQTYSSHPSHQVFLRAYELNAAGRPVATGKLLENRTAGTDGQFFTADDVRTGGMETWAVVKAHAARFLGIQLTDQDVFDVPLLATDAYGNFIPGPRGFAQVVMKGADGLPGTADDVLVEGNPAAPISLANAVRTGHAFLNDIAHSANPRSSSGAALAPDADTVAGVDDHLSGTYDNELLNAHYIAGDGRVNENIGLTTVHHVFHSEHNRLVDHTKSVILGSGDLAFLRDWLLPGTAPASFPVTQAQINALQWDGERVFQAAKFGTEMQYQHLVFEEFARTVQPNVDAFIEFNATMNPAIVAEFAHTVYRFGHSMLLETIDRLDPNFASSEIGLIAAFLNPLEFAASGPTPAQAAGAIVRGTTRQVGNEIDEFVTEALRNNLLGLPLDLATINLARGRDTGVPSLNAARREFFDATGDSQLKPYTSWVDFAGYVKHEESIINFIAAYGTHSSITGATTTAAKRAAAMNIVFGGAGEPADRLDFLNSTGTWASGANGVTTTGLDNVDLWIGGLAEEKMPFGGMLGSTFNFVFETQLEALQNGDRLYYLHRLLGTNFVAELENNSFAKLVMLNTDATHLPALIFSTPGFTFEVDPTRQFTGLGADGRADPVGDSVLVPLVIRNNPATPGADTNYLRYTGDEHVVLGGTAGNDILVSSEGDDTLYGDGGNDRLEGGYGNDDLQGGAGDDIITDMGGDDVIKGDDGNDVIQGGNGLNLIIGGRGSDFIITGEDISEVIAGEGNDFILGAKTNVQMAGNEGDDWIEIGTQDGAPGDNFDPLGTDSVIGNDVFIGAGGFDEMIGEGGDDVFTGSDGPDKFKGMSGFDWVTYKNDRFGVFADMFKDAFNEAPLPLSSAAVMDRFGQVEGLSGSAFGDVLRGDNADAAEITAAGFTGSVLTNIGLINGLQAFLGTGVPEFRSGNIILGGGGSDIIEGRGGDDLIDGDAWLNVRISVRDRSNPNLEIRSVDSLKELVPDMVAGTINPGQLVAVREILRAGPDFDTAVFSDLAANYSVTLGPNGSIIVSHVAPTPGLGGGVTGDGIDRLTNIERLQFNDQSMTLVFGLNNDPVGLLSILDARTGTAEATPTTGQVLRVSAADVTDADNAGSGAITGPVSYIWQFEAVPGTGVFQDITAAGLGVRSPASAIGQTFTVTPDLAGLALRVRAVYQDEHGVLENVFSAGTAPVAAGAPAPAPVTPLDVGTQTSSSSAGVHLIRSDLQFILDQIVVSERHAAGENLTDLLPHIRFAGGMRTVDGSFNNLVQDQSEFGAADTVFPRMLDPTFRNAEAAPPGFGPPTPTSYQQTSGNVFDSQPRTISNLIVDQTVTNASAYQTAYDAGADGVFAYAATAGADGLLGTADDGAGADGIFGTADDTDDVLMDGAHIVNGFRTDGTPFQTFQFDNVAPDAGLTAPFNAWMTFFGQFFDHGLDLVTKGGSGTVFIPLKADDPLFVPGSPTNFMVVTRATNLPGADGILGTADDIHEHENTTSPFVDQNQTYSSHPSHQVFLRAYELNAAGDPVSTGKLIVNRSLGADGKFGTADDVVQGGMATWAVVKAQARDLLGINLTDADFDNVPLLATDAYGNFIPGANGFVQVVMKGADGLAGTADDVLVEGNPLAPISLANAVRTGHAFLNDIAHNAVPGAGLAPDADNVAGGPVAAGFYDNELLDAHYIAGDGRVNENIGLTTVHHVFHAEHNRLVEHTKDVVLATTADGDVSFLNQWLITPVTAVPADPSTLVWNGERLFQAAKFGTEMQYQHLVFEEFARTIQPQVDLFFAPTQVYDTDLNPAIVAEFAHTVYRFGHSMLTETIDRLDPSFASSEIGLIQAFLNPLEFAASGPTAEEAAGAIVRGVTRQVGNEIDEFVTEALRNNLVGLPLDLPAINLARGRDAGIPSLNAARREFYDMTGDSQLKPYTSWVDFTAYLKHESSIINFVAAYGTHSSITGATTLAAKRAAAMNIVFGGAGEPADRLDFLNSTGTWASGANGVTTTGLDNVDLWIGGLAEEKMPFGGMLGSTFNFVFETQLEKLQDGDRFYYLDRTAGLNFVTELENNSFAKLIMANTDATHLPALVFQTPGLILEVDPTRQFNADVTLPGPDGIPGTADDISAPTADPIGDSIFTPLVIRDNPATPGLDTNYLRYTGDEHVVLGGTAGNDILIASEGDDTLWGDAGNDRIEGGYGNDQIEGGAGDDIITDIGGDDVIKGNDGNDVIQGGNGINLIIAGFGNDFVISGEDSNEVFGGPGNDFIFGNIADEQLMGNEGDDWIEHGTADGAPGDNFDPNGLDPIAGNDVFMGDAFPDIFNAEGGDDIMAGNGGEGDKYLGASGFDWAVFGLETHGVNIDLDVRAFVTAAVPASAETLSRFAQVEGLSGSTFSDILSGDHADATVIATAGAKGSVLTNIALIDGLQAFLGTGVTSFGSGNIILGGDGSDLIEGRGGDDLIDGDAWLNVRISVRDAANPNLEIGTVYSMQDLVPAMLAGTINPGQLRIVREILYADGSTDTDTAIFSGPLANYTVAVAADGTAIVTDNVGTDGSDRLTHIEQLRFSDQTVVIQDNGNVGPLGLLTIDDATPTEDQLLHVSAADVRDPNNVSATNPTGAISGPIAFFWQFEPRPGTGIFEDIIIVAGGVGTGPATGTTFRPGDAEVGLSLRVRGVYQDANGVLEEVFSAPTAAVENVNDPATGIPVISDATPTEGQTLTAATNLIFDPDGTAAAVFSFQWQQLIGTVWTPIAGAVDPLFTPEQAQVGRALRVVATFTDDQGGVETATSAPTGPVGDFILGTAASETLNGTPFDDLIDGLGGNDVINGLAGDDVLSGDTGNDTLNGGAGMDAMFGGLGNDTYVVDNVGDTVNEFPDEGTDTVQTTLASYALGADVENLTFTGTGNFSGTGNELANVITGGAGNDTLDGGAGNDTLNGVGGNDALRGGTGNDTLNGAAGDDTLDGGAGTDSMAGGTGNDTYVVDIAADVVTEAAGAGTDTVRTTLASYTLGTNVENLVFIGAGNFSGTGNALNNAITGGAGNDTLNGGAGDDTLDGGAGNDTMIGGTGNDSFVVDSTVDVITEAANAGTDTVQTTLAAYTLATNLENLTFIGAGDFTGTGNGAANVITGGAGNDTLSGGAGNDTLNGGAGNDALNGGTGSDAMAGGSGDDTYVVDATGDVVTEAAGAGTDAVQTTLASYTLGANVENLTFTGAGNFSGTGNALNNAITGGAGNDTLSGAAGDDTLNGGAGADAMAGGTGNDIFVVDNAGDVVTEAAGAGTDIVLTTLASYTLAANVENLTFVGVGNFSGTGNTLANIITGGAGADSMAGGAGNDTYVVDNAGDVITEAAGAGTDAVQTTLAAYTLTANVENLTFTGAGNFSGTGNVLNNAITGGAGNDTLNGGAGLDSMAGGAGDDTYVVDNAGDVVTEAAGAGTDTVQTTLASYTLGANAENLTFVGVGNFSGTGNGLANIITGGAGNDTLTGGASDDTLNGGAGVDSMIGGAGNDTYVVDNAGDVVTEAAGEGTDTVQTTLASYALAANVENLTFTGTGSFSGTGNALANTITGGAGDDTLNGGAGADALAGGTGNDTYVVDNAGDIVTEAAGAGTDTVRTTLSSYTLGANVENLTFTGTGSFSGTGNALANTMIGGAGDDSLDGGAGADAMAGGIGNDIYVVDNAGDVVTEAAGEGTDTARTTLASYALGANVENLTFIGAGNFSGTGNEAANVITGGAGNDTLNGGAGVDSMIGGAGNDIYVVDNAGDVVTEAAGAGIDTVQTTLASYALAADLENLTFVGTGDFTGTGNSAANVIAGGAGNDTLDGGAGSDSMVGGAGNDIYVVDNAGDVVTEAAGAGTDTVRTTLASYALAANVENLTFTGAGNFSGTGNALANIVTGGDGNDTLNGGAGVDSMAGGAGNDTYVVDVAGDVVTEAAGAGTDTVQTALASYTLGTNVENLTFTGAGNFSGTGNALANIVTGGAGDDTLNGGDGNDTLNGGAGADSMVGGAGDDIYVVNVAGDVVTEAAGAGTDTVQTTLASYTLGANVENLTFIGTGNFTGTGNTLANIIIGGAGNDTLNGGTGDDTLNGGAGVDSMAGGAGNDTFVVDNAGDVVTEAASAGTDTVRTTLASYTLGANLENLTFTGAGTFSGTGNALANVITGGAGTDTLNGGDGNDTLIGGTGNDSMNGGSGNDIFVFAAGFGNDTITGFDANANNGQDLLNISALGITAATFAGLVTITDLGADTLVGIGGDSMLLLGVNGTAPNNITQADFMLA